MVGFRDLVGTDIAPVSKKTAVKRYLKFKTLFDTESWIFKVDENHLVNLIEDLTEMRITFEINPPVFGDLMILNLWSNHDLGFLQALTCLGFPLEVLDQSSDLGWIRNPRPRSRFYSYLKSWNVYSLDHLTSLHSSLLWHYAGKTKAEIMTTFSNA